MRISQKLSSQIYKWLFGQIKIFDHFTFFGDFSVFFEVLASAGFLALAGAFLATFVGEGSSSSSPLSESGAFCLGLTSLGFELKI